MPNWGDVLKEIQACEFKDSLDRVRRKYLGQLHAKTGRNVIAYYSGWLQKPNLAQTSIGDDDKNALMAVIHGMDRSLGLDLMLHTPGGNLAATESIVDYLHRMFGQNIRAIIPQIAMSAGTMIACACKEVIMGKQSNLGPIDPQFGGVPAHGVIDEFETAIRQVKRDPGSIPIWQAIISKYHPTFIGECRHAIDWSEKMVAAWLEQGMFHGRKDSKKAAKDAVGFFGNHNSTKSHSRHINIDEASRFLKVQRLEVDDDLQDIVLTVHHAFMHTFSNSPIIKIVENHGGQATMIAVK